MFACLGTEIVNKNADSAEHQLFSAPTIGGKCPMTLHRVVGGASVLCIALHLISRYKYKHKIM